MKHLYNALSVLIVLLYLGLPTTVWASGDWKRSDEYRIFEPGDVRENFPIANTRDLIGDDAGTSYVWQKAEPLGGVWIDQIYRSFIEQMGIGDYTTPELSRSIFFYVNKGVDAGDIVAGESYWIPADNNKPESVQQAFAKRLEQRAIARAKAQPVTRGELDNMLSNVTIELDGNKAAEVWVQRQATELLETQGGKILEEDLIGLVATAVANQNLVSKEEFDAINDEHTDRLLDLADIFDESQEAANERFGGIEATQSQQGIVLKELRATVENIKDAQANQADTLTDHGDRLDGHDDQFAAVEERLNRLRAARLAFREVEGNDEKEAFAPTSAKADGSGGTQPPGSPAPDEPTTSSSNLSWIALAFALVALLAALAMVGAGFAIARSKSAAKTANKVKGDVDNLGKQVDDHARRLALLEFSALDGMLTKESVEQLRLRLEPLLQRECDSVSFFVRNDIETAADIEVTIRRSDGRSEAGWHLSLVGTGDYSVIQPKKTSDGSWAVLPTQVASLLVKARNAGAFRKEVPSPRFQKAG